MEERLDLLIHKIQPIVESLKVQYPVPEDEAKFITIPDISNPNTPDKFIIFTYWSMAYTYFFLKYKLFERKLEYLNMIKPEDRMFLSQDLTIDQVMEIHNKMTEYKRIYSEFVLKYNIMTEESIQKLNDNSLTFNELKEDEKHKEFIKEIIEG